MSVGQWEQYFVGLTAPEPYGDDITYRMAAEWTQGCATIEDWGAGTGWLRQFCDHASYVGVDGSHSPFADVVDDLATRETQAEGIVLRHVLEHNHNWPDILDNAVRSFTKRLFIAIFTPMCERTHVLQTEPAYGDVPVISFRQEDIHSRLRQRRMWTHVEKVRSGTFYGAETVFRVTRVNSVAVYTAITGEYDTLLPHPDIPGVDWIAHLDKPQPRDDWHVVPIPENPAHPRIVAKAYKLLPWLFGEMGRYEHTIWIDGSHQITSPAFVDEALACLSPDGLAMHRHPMRDCIYAEAGASSWMKKYEGLPIAEQVQHYRMLGHPEHWGLWACGCIARARNDRLSRLMLDWWDECQRWTYQDQISLPFVLRQAGMRPGEFPYPQYQSPWHAIVGHHSDL